MSQEMDWLPTNLCFTTILDYELKEEEIRIMNEKNIYIKFNKKRKRNEKENKQNKKRRIIQLKK